ncbi:MAG: hypothetical protein HYS62_00430 [Candidatus Aenigmarchaeota archaeon]|nr:hypothetical protein [Candidatus Aenigmarchaeota archaeon]
MYFTPNGGFEVKLVDVGHLNDSGRNSELIVPHYDSQRAIEREDKIYFTHTIQMEKGTSKSGKTSKKFERPQFACSKCSKTIEVSALKKK